MDKEFKYTVKSKRGKTLVEEIVKYSNFPDDWKDNPMVQMGLMEYKQEILEKHFDVEISDDLEFTINDLQGEEDEKELESLRDYKTDLKWLVDNGATYEELMERINSL